MRTVEEFNKIVEKENEYCDQCILRLKKPIYVIPHAYEIAKRQAIYDYIKGRVIPSIQNGEEMFKDFLISEFRTPIASIYTYECCRYDEPQWTTWDNLDDVVRNMFAEIKNQNN